MRPVLQIVLIAGGIGAALIALAAIALGTASIPGPVSVNASGDHQFMNFEQNKSLVRSYLNEIVNKGNIAAFDSYFSEDVVFNGAKNFKEQLARVLATRSAFPDLHLTIEDQIAEGDKVVTRVTFHGTHQGQFNGIAPTGRKVQWSGIAMDRIANGKVVEMWHVQSTMALLQQIGAAAPTAPQK